MGTSAIFPPLPRTRISPRSRSSEPQGPPSHRSERRRGRGRVPRSRSSPQAQPLAIRRGVDHSREASRRSTGGIARALRPPAAVEAWQRWTHLKRLPPERLNRSEADDECPECGTGLRPGACPHTHPPVPHRHPRSTALGPPDHGYGVGPVGVPVDRHRGRHDGVNLRGAARECRGRFLRNDGGFHAFCGLTACFCPGD